MRKKFFYSYYVSHTYRKLFSNSDVVEFINNKLFEYISDRKKIIIKELENEFRYEILSYNEMKKLAKNILNALNRK